jgi:glycosyltransferase involved in cell wall biosynthesis
MTPRVSILVPFYRDDPSPLIAALAGQWRHGGGAELILYDDGGGDPLLIARLEAALYAFPAPARLIRGSVNRGRAFARNALAAVASARHLLFLDADMLPAAPNFLGCWLQEADADPAIVFGGFSMPEHAGHEGALHRAFSAAGDCLDAQARSRNPAQYVFTSNLMVRASLLQNIPFDASFSGWGWEDAEWAARAAQSCAILHIDNPAVHLGLESADTLLRRFRDSAANYARYVRRHPELAATLASHVWATRLKRVHGARPMRPLLAALARGVAPAPMRIRVLALKLWRASWYSEAL